jgi:Cof subfamily protein (haloacid dehalogenase superfamily)
LAQHISFPKKHISTFKTLCFDLDGTLLALKSHMTPKAYEYLGALKDKHQLLLCSARIPSGMRYHQESIGILGAPMLCYNGALLLEGEQVVYSKTIAESALESVDLLLDHLEVNWGLYAFDQWWVSKDSERVQKERYNTQTEPLWGETRSTIKRLVDEFGGVHKIMLMGDKNNMDLAMDALAPLQGTSLVYFRSNDTLIEIAPSGVGKKEGVTYLLGNNGLSEAMAFGDNDNDIDLLQASGWGVAVHNAKPLVQSIADAVTPLSCADDGVIDYLSMCYGK